MEPGSSVTADGRGEGAASSVVADGRASVVLTTDAGDGVSAASQAIPAVGSTIIPLVALPHADLSDSMFVLERSQGQYAHGRSYHQTAHLLLGRVRAVETNVAKYNDFVAKEDVYVEVFGRPQRASSVDVEQRSRRGSQPRYVAKLESCGVDFDLNFFASVDEEKDDDEAGSPGSAFGLSYSLLGGELHPCRYVGSRRLCTLPAVPSICAPECSRPPPRVQLEGSCAPLRRSAPALLRVPALPGWLWSIGTVPHRLLLTPVHLVVRL